MQEDIPLLFGVPAAALKRAPRRVSRLQAMNDCFQALGITFRVNRECRVSTQLSQSRWVSRTAGVGHEDQFRPPGLSACCRFPQQTFAGTHGNIQDAPIADLPGLTPERGGSNPKRPLAFFIR